MATSTTNPFAAYDSGQRQAIRDQLNAALQSGALTGVQIGGVARAMKQLADIDQPAPPPEPSLPEKILNLDKSLTLGSARGAWDALKGMALAGTPTSLPEAGAFLIGGPPALTTYKAVAAQGAEADKARAAAEQGRTSEALGYSAAAGLPILGPTASHVGERIGKGKIPELLGEAGVMAATGALGEGYMAGEPGRIAARAAAAPDEFTQIFQPPARDFRFEASRDAAIPEMMEQVRQEGKPVRSVADALGVIRRAKDRMRNTYESFIAPYRKSIVINGTEELVPALRATIDEKTLSESPSAAQAIAQKAQGYSRAIPLPEAERLLEQTNRRLDAFHRKDQMGQASAGEQQTAAFDLALARGLRQSIYDRTNQMAGPGVAQVQRTYGALKDMERYAGPLAIEIKRYGGKNIPKEVAEIAADTSAGLMYSRAGGAIRAARGIKNTFLQRTLDQRMARAFLDLKDVPATTPVPNLPVQPLRLGLPAGAVRVGGVPDTSFVHGEAAPPPFWGENRQLSAGEPGVGRMSVATPSTQGGSVRTSNAGLPMMDRNAVARLNALRSLDDASLMAARQIAVRQFPDVVALIDFELQRRGAPIPPQP